MKDGYATHIPVLAKAAAEADPSKPILELGCGDYSTPMLAQFGEVHVYTTSREWGEKYEDIAQVNYIDAWPGFRLEGRYSLAFQDSEELVINRIKHLDWLLDVADVVVMHDWRVELPQPPRCSSAIYERYVPWTWRGWRA